jgi:alpha-glucosidase
MTIKSLRSSKLVAAALVAFLCAASLVGAQTLARPGWVGSGLTAQTWWKRAVLYEIDVRGFASASDAGHPRPAGLKGIAPHLDYLRSLGVDAILLTPLGSSAPASGSANSQPAPIDPVFGTLDDFDDLLLQASRQGIRILLELPQADPALARFWLARGVAGFYIPGSSSANADAVQVIRKLLPGFVGRRVLITDAAPSATTSAGSAKPSINELVFDGDLLKLPTGAPTETAAQVRTALDQSQALLRATTPVIATDAPALPRSLNRFGDRIAAESAIARTASGRIAAEEGMAKIIATVLLLNRSAALLYAGQELGLSSPTGAAVAMPWGPPPARVVPDEPPSPAAPAGRPPSDVYLPYNPHKSAPAASAPKSPPPDPATAAGQDANPKSLLNFYRQLSQLHRGTTALHDGEEILLNHDDQNALVWVRRPPAPSLQRPAIVVVCNLSDKPVVLSLRADMARLRLRGSFLRTVLRSDDALGSMDLNSMTLLPFGVYIGELRF